MIRIKNFTFNLFAENTLVVWDDKTFECAIVDPGNSNSEEEKMLEEFISSNKLKMKYLVNTHCHIDHILGCRFVKEKYNPVYLAPELDLSLLKFAQKQAEAFDIKMEDPPLPDQFLNEEAYITLGDSVGKFIFTPGHSPGEFCIYFENEKLCITGDVLFNEGIGRTDLWGGDYKTLIDSIKSKLFKLPDNVKIYPGHGETSTIGHEKLNNPFLNNS
ncbi:MAG TPA: MBL fold metallo-hydrolase [Ignavibacteriaceae bacterium]|nr:MBL fold metallo-hydrolase [Ignavibacteriaceae bacterium]